MFGVTEPHFKYEDDEKDLVTITSDLELREAVAVSAKTGTVLRLFLTGLLFSSLNCIVHDNDCDKTEKETKANEPTVPTPTFNNTTTMNNPISQLIGSLNPQIFANPALFSSIAPMLANPAISQLVSQFAHIAQSTALPPTPTPAPVPVPTPSPAVPAEERKGMQHSFIFKFCIYYCYHFAYLFFSAREHCV